jgi:hypothetical protein
LTADNYVQAPLVQRLSYKYGADFSIRPVNISEHYYQNTEQDGNFDTEGVWRTVKYLARARRMKPETHVRSSMVFNARRAG